MSLKQKSAQRKTGTLFLLVGPSRVGKDSILRALLRRKSLGLRKLVTMTTRERRPREIAGRTYHYVSEAEFVRRIKQKRFLEWMPVRNYRFGTPRQPLLNWLKAGHDIIQQVDVRGAAALRKIKGIRMVTIFILPGSIKELKQRLANKAFTPEQRKIRLQEAMDELRRQTEFDYRIVNASGKMKQAIDEAVSIIKAHQPTKSLK